MSSLKGCLFALIFAIFSLQSSYGQSVIINEFMADNEDTLSDEDMEFSDWIELRNLTAAPINLEGYILTDNPSSNKWRFPAVSIPANGYLVVFASGKDRTNNVARLHTSFSLSANGEYLALRAPDGVTVLTEFSPAYPAQEEDFSYGYAGGGTNLNFFSRATPGAANGTGVTAFVSDTKFSHDRGFYTNAFSLVISTTTAGTTIRYNTNGVPPTATSGIVYVGPLTISGTTTIRAAAFRDGYQPSNVDTVTYLFLDDIIRQSPDGSPPPGWPSSWGQNSVDYGMDPNIVNHPEYGPTIKNDLKSIPSFSLVLPLNHLFHSSTGIYANPRNDGIDWERACSLELIYPNGTKGFQSNAGIRIRGGFSRDPGNPKHAFRFFFREEYGDGKLNYPLFGEDAAQEFDKFDLRTFQNYSWSYGGDPNGIFLRDQFNRDLQLAMGHPAERGDFYHLYINGVYWGLYNTCERPEAAYGESYLGGKETDYDTIKVEAGPYTINATDGNGLAWSSLYNQARAGLESDANYFKIQGRNPDGTRNPGYPNLLDVPNLIDYMLLILYGGNLDAPISNFLGNERPNNWYGLRNRNGTNGFIFFIHDAEHTLLPGELERDRHGPFNAGSSSIIYSNPQYIWQQCLANREFRMLVADHIHRHFFNGGLLTSEKTTEMLYRRKDEIDRAVVGESARWGNSKREPALTRDDWENAINAVVSYLSLRSAVVYDQFLSYQLYPSIVAPSFSQHGGNFFRGTTLRMSAPEGTIYYTRDGSDPRMIGGAVSPNALVYSTPLPMNESVHLKSRTRVGTNWSALNEAMFTAIYTYNTLLITEIMYHPVNGNTNVADPEHLEFIELKNVGPSELDLSGVRFTNGVRYTFPLGKKLAPGKFALLVGNAAAFTNVYPGVEVDGVFTNNLSNSGEEIALIHAAGQPIMRFSYGDQAPWPAAADGVGFSLVSRSPSFNSDPTNPANWRASSAIGGSPGRDDPSAGTAPVVISEILTHTDPPLLDSIEIHNPRPVAADISNWYLTDDRLTPKKFKLPTTVIPPGGFVVFTETSFNPSPGIEPSFTLSSHGDEVYLYSADAAGNLTGYSDGFAFGAAANAVTFGRMTNSAGDILYPAQLSPTPGASNSGPMIGPVVIHEIRHSPSPGEEQFVEIKNITSQTVPLFHPTFPTNTWRVEGLSFSFPEGAQLPPNGLAIITSGDPLAFRQRYGVPPQVAIYGPFDGNLQAGGETLQLLRPDNPDVSSNEVTVPYIVVDEVRYDNFSPWPFPLAGESIEKKIASAFGNDPAAWRLSRGVASPGLENDGNRPPRANAGNDQSLTVASFPHEAILAGSFTDDGLPEPPATVTVQWMQVSGPASAQFITSGVTNARVWIPGIGTYVFRMSASDSSLVAHDEMIITVTRPLAETVFFPTGSQWRYLDTGVDQGTNWVSVDFNDNGWKTGLGEFGYGDGDEATRLDYGPSEANKYPTYYFRKSFDIANPSSINELSLSVRRDDGCVAYLNGVEIFRSNMPVEDITFDTLASNTSTGADEIQLHNQPLDPTLLRPGRNVIAVEVHQQSRSSSTDVSFDALLEGRISTSNQPPTANAGPDLSVTLPASVQLQGSFSDDGLPAITSNRWTLVSGPGTVEFNDSSLPNAIVTFSTAGSYVLRFKVDDSALSAQDETTITVQGGSSSYSSWAGAQFTAAELENASVSGENADPDGDLFTNMQEYIAGTLPKDSSSYLKLSNILSEEAGNVEIKFQAMAEKTYTIQWRPLAETGTWQRLQDVPAGAARTVAVIDPASGGDTTRFYRIVTPAMAP
ncbi:MAG: lamin tail domain-containing protein [Verrucomicrobiota bacterium]|nr:lamin tail domain-containing protein [Verrucomicrobiota bacterium]